MKNIIFSNFSGDNSGDYYCLPSLYYDFKNTSYQNFGSLRKYVNKVKKNNIYIIGGGGILDTNQINNNFFNKLKFMLSLLSYILFL